MQRYVLSAAPRIWVRSILVAILMLAGCKTPPVEDTRREASVPAVPPLVQRPPLRVPVRVTWSFRAGDNECSATAAAGATSLQVSVRRNMPIRMVVSLSSRPTESSAVVPVRFNGSAGNWQIVARRLGDRQITATLGSDDTALSRILVLLGGGTMELGGGQVQPIASLAIPESGSEGRAWFDCVRAQTF